MTSTAQSEPTVLPEQAAGFEVATVSADTLRAGIRVVGTLDATTTPLLAGILRTHTVAGRRYLRVDLRAATLDDAATIDPAVVRTLAAAHAAVDALGGMLVLENATPLVLAAARAAGCYARAAD
ncbi:hypothetical protein SAMN05443575_1580 [Jatrophihabitans endophyticus]|uniref:STAS domain-containing protein n=1 Tax=Jatrophihabitans endophyticus TaxID=1206085 RepID=A0A1M5HNC8_9ACTN|nr:hypothetical protein [Jatrophihabitans endophyticus]SHG17473.1 hypothetical protein SAMN05443575_1580 [Jatrophihabitans endophyticus]